MNKETIEAIATKVHWDLIPALESGSSRAILVEIVTAVLEVYEANRPKFWWEDAHLRMPKYEDSEKIDEWEACYAFLFTQMNKMAADFHALKNSKKMVEGVDYTKSCGNVFEDLGITKPTEDK